MASDSESDISSEGSQETDDLGHVKFIDESIDSNSVNVEYQALKNYEDELILCLEGVDLVPLARQAAECGIVLQDVEVNLENLHSKVPHPSKCRYLFYNVYNNLINQNGSSAVVHYDKWIEILSYLPVTSRVLSQVQQNHSQLHDTLTSEKTNLTAHVLTKNHISLLTEVLANCTSKWKEIGMALGMPYNEIRNIIEMMHIYSPVMRLAEVLSGWVMCRFKGAIPPTLLNLEMALRSQTVGLGAEANQLGEKIGRQLSILELSKHKESPKRYEIISQTRNQTACEETSVLLEVCVSVPSNLPVAFEWQKDDKRLYKASQITNSHNGYNVSILFLSIESILSQGSYTCCIKNQKDILKTSPIILTVTTPLDKYQRKFIDFYREQPEVPEYTWPPVSGNSFIRLALIKQDSIYHAGEYGRSTIQGNVDDIYKDKESLVYEMAFSGLSSGARLLVEGRPGSGKTTLVHKISQDWAKQALVFESVRLLILVHLRAFSGSLKANLDNILDCYFWNSSESAKKEIIDYAVRHNGLGFCFILDGLDEYLPKSDNSFILQLIKKKALPKAIVIVASRPAAVAKFRQKASRQVEVLGFLKDQISDYINDYPFVPDSKRGDLFQYLDQHPNVHHMCYLPIHAAMVCYLFQNLEVSLPRTETEIYREFTLSTILRSLYRDSDQSVTCINSVEDLNKRSRDVYYKICEVAFQMCESSKQVMSEIQAHPTFGIEDVDGILGLITIDKMALKSGFQRMYTFHHLTFQEFLGACYISSLGEEKQIELIAELGNAEQMQQVWKFFCGLAKFDDQSGKLQHFMTNTEFGSLFKVQCGFESQQACVCDSVVESNSLSFSDTFLSPSNFLQIAYIISNALCNMVSNLSFVKCHFEQECVDVLVEKAKTKLSLLSVLRYHPSSYCKLIDMASLFSHLQSVEILDISDRVYRNQPIKSFTGSVSNNNLRIVHVTYRDFPLLLSKKPPASANFSTEGCFFNLYLSFQTHTTNIQCGYFYLNLSGTKLSQTVFKVFTTDLVTNPYFRRLTLTQCGIDDEMASYFAQGLKLCAELEVLELGFNDIGDIGATEIAESVRLHTKMTLLDFTCNEISDYGAKRLTSGIKSNVRVILSFNRITGYNEIIQKSDAAVEFHSVDVSQKELWDKDVDWLASTLHSTTKTDDMIKLNFSMTSLSLSSVECLSSVLTQCHNLLILDLSSNSLCGASALILSGALKHCVKLHNINLSSNCLGSYGAEAIADGIRYCSYLLQFKINNNGIRSEGTRALVEGLKGCQILQELEIGSNQIGAGIGIKALACAFSNRCWTNFSNLDISCNKITSKGCKVLAEALTQCTTLLELNISNNDIQSKGAFFLASFLHNCRKLQVLNVSCNSLRSTGAQAITNLLHHNLSLHTLDISNNNIGKYGTQSLANSLRSTKLSNLNVSRNYMEPKGAESLANCLMELCKGNLSRVDISYSTACGALSSHITEALYYCTNIQELNLSHNLVSTHFLKSLARFLQHNRNLQILDVCSIGMGATGAQILAKGLEHCTRLHTLLISDNHISDDGAVALTNVFKSLKKLQYIDLSRNSIESKCSSTLTNSLKDCERLSDLNISWNHINYTDLKKVVDVFQLSRSIRVLKVNGLKLRSSGVKILVSGLVLCSNLKELHISANCIGADGAEALAEALKLCVSLQVLDVSRNPIGQDGANALIDTFKYNCAHLQEINFSQCQITAVPEPTFKHCPKLHNLSISGNQLGSLVHPSLPSSIAWFPDSGHFLTDLIINGCFLRYFHVKMLSSTIAKIQLLDISHNPIGDKGAFALADALRGNTRLHTLCLQRTCIDTEGVSALAEALQDCTSLSTLDIRTNCFENRDIEVVLLSLEHCSELMY